jgi:SAM-dependent methyltransferase
MRRVVRLPRRNDGPPVGGPLDDVEQYYSGTVARHGPTALGVDWPNTPSQYLRFIQLLRICDFSVPLSLNDFGCGYGALLAFLAERHPEAEVHYHGIDISHAMVEAGRSLWGDCPGVDFSVGSQCRLMSDYSLASGVFNVRLGWPVDEWEAYVASILRELHSHSRKGFAVNFMLPLDGRPMEEGLYRTMPDPWLDLCEGELGCTAELVGNYGLREFTLLARP